MRFQVRIVPAIGTSLLVFHLATATGHAADRNRSGGSGQPRDLINQPVCWSAEEPDDPRYCDFANKI